MTTETTAAPPTLTIDGVAFVWDEDCKMFSAGCMSVYLYAAVMGGIFWEACADGAVYAESMTHRSPAAAVTDLRAKMHVRIEADRADANRAIRRADRFEAELAGFAPC